MPMRRSRRQPPMVRPTRGSGGLADMGFPQRGQADALPSATGSLVITRSQLPQRRTVGMGRVDRGHGLRLGYSDFHRVAATTPLTRRCDGGKKPADGRAPPPRCHPMRNLAALGMLFGGIWIAGLAWWPSSLRLPLPASLQEWTLPAGAVLAALGLVALLWRAPRRPAFGDGPLVSTLTEA